MGIAGLAVLAVVLMTGCAGITAPFSVSPATFLLPGLLEVPQESDPVVVAPIENADCQLSAQSR